MAELTPPADSVKWLSGITSREYIMRYGTRSGTAGYLAAMGLILLALQTAGAAAPQAGDKPNIAMKTVDGRAVTSAILKGRIIVFDFWATWCGPCMAEVPHMIQVNQKYADQGVAIIGISLDNDLNSMTTVARQQGMTWPQICDGGGWASPIAKAWAVTSIPHAVILSPDGEILWIGYPANIEEPLADALKKYPTQPGLQRKAQETLGGVLKVLTDEKDTAKAIGLLADLPAGVQPDAGLKTAATKLAALLGKDALEANPDAAKALVALGAPKSAANHPAGPAAATPSAAPSVALAESKLAAADKARAAGQNLDAYNGYKWIVTHAAGTPAADAAQPRVAAYENDAAFMAGLQKAAREKDAGSLLWLAQSRHRTYSCHARSCL